MEIILASASLQRKELLKIIVNDFKIVPADIEENIVGKQDDAVKVAETLALKKAEKVSVQYPEALVIGADTVVEMGGTIYGKPKDDLEAVKILKELRGTVQKVITGIAVICNRKNISLVDSETTLVRMKSNISDKEIEDYVKSGEGKDKAGGYAFQGKGDKFIEWFKGDHYNIVGFPIGIIYMMLKEAKDRWNLEIDLIYNKQKQDEFIC